MNTPILLIGNGLNLSFAEEPVSVSALISDKKDYEKIVIPDNEGIPFHMQVVLHSHDRVDELMKERAGLLWGEVRKDSELYRYYKKLLELPVKDILTTNYDFCLEETVIDVERISGYMLDKSRDYFRVRGLKRAESQMFLHTFQKLL